MGLGPLGLAPLGESKAQLQLEYSAKQEVPELASLALRLAEKAPKREVLQAVRFRRDHGWAQKDLDRSVSVHEILRFAGASFFSFEKPGGAS